MSDELFKVTLTLKSGATVETVVSSFRVRENGLGETIGYEWNTPPGYPKILDVVISEVAAIISQPFTP